MRQIGYGIGVALALVAAVTLVAQLFSILAEGAFVPVSPRSVWQVADPDSLEGLRATVEQGILPAAWPPLAWILSLPAWAIAGALALPLILRNRPRRRGFD